MGITNNDQIIYQELQELKQMVASIQEKSVNKTQEERYLTVPETAVFLDCSEQHVYRLKAKIPHYYRVGKLKFKLSDLVIFMEEGREEPKRKR